MVEIPQDIIDNIIAEVGDDECLLQKCALVSSSFLCPSRKQLFSKISIRSGKTCQRIHQIFVQNPVIQSFVRYIYILDYPLMSGTPEWMNNSTSLLAILRLPFCCLEYFSINSGVRRRRLDWNSFSSELNDALSSIVHSSTLKTLSLNYIVRVPITFFLHIVHLTTLELYYISLSDPGDENSSSLTLAASKGVAPMVSHTVIDECVWVFEVEDMRHGPLGSTFLPFMCRLRISLNFTNTYDFKILSSLMDSLCISLISPATLEQLEVNIILLYDHVFDVDMFYQGLHDAEAWSHLDSFTTHPSGSRLQQVNIYVDYFTSEDNWNDPSEDEILKAVYDGLPLLCTKGILSVKVTGGFD